MSLLGEVTIRHNDVALPCPSTKALELLGFLITRRDHPLARDSVADALWPDERPEATRRQLRQALWRLRGALAGAPFLRTARGGRLEVDVTAFASVDLVLLEEAHAETADVAGTQLSDRQAERLEIAVAGYGGDFLAGCHQDWCMPERTRAREIHMSLRDQLIGYCEPRRLVARALAHGRAVLEREPARETTHRLLMRLHHRSGDRAAALRQYGQCVEALAAEYDVGPSALTTQLHRRIREDDGARDGAERPSAGDDREDCDERGDGGGRGSRPEIAALHERLGEIQASLDILLLAIGHGAGAGAGAGRGAGSPVGRPE
ncbi:AfsR/SARP family transcriptional regulator [Pseudofrankia inefficax]|uniref:AfsR/SARP family transcriptional regulator n=1 Tax=Pseudofrankia inefficax (strain DSM 45817 / CECT 9037 / DDB 130130 / EuI1c) TaxID=298654 RepID=UPI0018DFF23D|nr:BTAD domain-containing putative transcriptional regulator [Pseudofrankia inefficax]